MVIKPVFSNPFIEIDSRLQHYATLYDYLRAGDGERFAILSVAYRIWYVVVIDDSQPAFRDPQLELAFRDEGVAIYAVSLPSAAPVNLGDKGENAERSSATSADQRCPSPGPECSSTNTRTLLRAAPGDQQAFRMVWPYLVRGNNPGVAGSLAPARGRDQCRTLSGPEPSRS